MIGIIQGEWVCFKDSKNILHEILDWRAREGRAKKHSQFSPTQVELVRRWLNRQCSLAQPSLGLQSRISYKIFSKSLKHTRSPCEYPAFRLHSFTYSYLIILCCANNQDYIVVAKTLGLGNSSYKMVISTGTFCTFLGIPTWRLNEQGPSRTFEICLAPFKIAKDFYFFKPPYGRSYGKQILR